MAPAEIFQRNSVPSPLSPERFGHDFVSLSQAPGTVSWSLAQKLCHPELEPPATRGSQALGTRPVQHETHCELRIHTQQQRLSTKRVKYFTSGFYIDYMLN